MTDYLGPETGPPSTTTTGTTTTDPSPTAPPGVRRFRRSRNDRVLAGVSGGLAEALALDPVIVRVLMVVLTFFGGAGLIVYGACWLLMPEDDRESSLAERAIARSGRTSWPLFVLAGAIGLAVVLGAGWVLDDRSLFLIALSVIAAILLYRRATGDSATSSGPGFSQTTPAPAPATWGAPAWAPTATEPLGPRPPLPPLPPADPSAPRSLLGRVTLCLVLLALGALATADLSGADVPAAAYPAVVVAGAGLGLLVGARYGRGRWLIALGVIGALALPPTIFADAYDGNWVDQDGRAIAPADTAGIAPTYSYRGGRVILDLSGVDFSEASVTTRLEVGAGDVSVILPPNVDVTTDLDLGVGLIEVFGTEHDGLGVSSQLRDDGVDGPGGGTLELAVSQGVGHLEVLRAAA